MIRPSPPRHGALSNALIVASISASVAISLAMDLVLITSAIAVPRESLVGAVLFNATCLVLSVVGGVIEWQRPGHTIGRLLMLSGPLYAYLGASWLTFGALQPLLERGAYDFVFWASPLLAWPGMAVIVGWIPLLFPTGKLPGPRWRIPAAILVAVSGITLVALGSQTSLSADRIETGGQAALINAIALELLALVVMAIAALIVRYRRGDRVERLQIRWFAAAVALCGVGFAATIIQFAVRTSDGPLLAALVAYAGILAMPITIGIAITRYRLYEIDRLISRTIGWTLVTGVLVTLFSATVLGLQAILAGFAQGGTFAVAASTLVAYAVFQPLRRRVQRAVDRRFDRPRYDGDRTASAFAERLQGEVDLDGVEADIAGTVDKALHPSSFRVWLRPSRRTTDPTIP